LKIALVGSASSSTHLAPYEDKTWDEYRQGQPQNYPPLPFKDEEWEIWGVSPGAAAQVRRATRWFEVHRWEPGQPWLSPEYCQFLRTFRGPVYTGGVIPEIPNHIVYPIERVVKEFTPYFLTSSLSLMMAIAILEIQDLRERDKKHDWDEDVIGFFGVDMSAAEEYGGQRFGCQHFILEAQNRDIGIYVPLESCLLRPMPVYGLQEWTHTYIKLTARARELTARKLQAVKQVEEGKQMMIGVTGAAEDLEYMVNTWISPYEGLESGVVVRKDVGNRARKRNRKNPKVT